MKKVVADAGVARQQAITWANVDPDFFHHMESLARKELMSLVNIKQSRARASATTKWLWYIHSTPSFSHIILLCSVSVQLSFQKKDYLFLS